MGYNKQNYQIKAVSIISRDCRLLYGGLLSSNIFFFFFIGVK